jgi:hypothetical protein
MFTRLTLGGDAITNTAKGAQRMAHVLLNREKAIASQSYFILQAQFVLTPVDHFREAAHLTPLLRVKRPPLRGPGQGWDRWVETSSSSAGEGLRSAGICITLTRRET